MKAHILERFSSKVTRWAGSTSAFTIAVIVVAGWLASGPLFHYSDTWQLVINTSTTIVTFLMVFLIQRAQNKDSRAIHMKLNELVAAMEGASNRLIDVEDLDEDEIATLHGYYARLVAKAKHEATLTQSHTIEEAESGTTRARGVVRKGGTHGSDDRQAQGQGKARGGPAHRRQDPRGAGRGRGEEG